mgnify:FL=1
MRSDVMSIFEEAGLVKVNQEGLGCATPRGLQCFLACCVLHEPVYGAGLRSDVALSDYSVWELVVHLDIELFRHIVKPPSKKDLPYNPSDLETKMWYSKPGETSISRLYLMTIAKGFETV